MGPEAAGSAPCRSSTRIRKSMRMKVRWAFGTARKPANPGRRLRAERAASMALSALTQSTKEAACQGKEGDMSSRWLNMPSLRTMTLLVVAPEGSA